MKTNIRKRRKYLRFDEAFHRFIKFCEKHQRLPKNKRSAEERINYDFMYRFKNNEQVIETINYYKLSEAERKIADLRKFCKEHGRLPKRTKDEMAMYIIYDKHRDLKEVQDIINEFKFSFTLKLEELKRFCEENDFLPRSTAKNGKERSLYKFRKKNEDKEEIIELEKNFVALKFEDLVSFCKTYDGFPRKGNNQKETRLYNFWYVHRDQQKFADLHDEYRTERSFRTIHELETFCNENNRMPSSKGSKYEKSLYDFYHKHKNEKPFIEIFSRFGRKHKDRSLHSIEELENFCLVHDRMPSAKIKQEKPLYDFYYINREKEAFRDLYSRFCNKTLNSYIQDFFNQYGRLPKDSSSNDEEKSLGERLIKNPDKALKGIEITLAPIVYQDFEQFTIAQQLEIMSIFGIPSTFMDEACKGRTKRATTETLKEVFKSHGAKLVTEDTISKRDTSTTEVGRLKRFSTVVEKYNPDLHSPYLINESLNNLWDTIIIESKHGSTSTYDELMSENELTKFFNVVRNTLLDEYKKVIEYVPGKEYSGKYDPDLMQRLCIIRLREKKYYANWSKAGTGKTLQSLLSSLDIDSKITLYILPNSTISDKVGTRKREGAIKEFIPNSNVIIYNGKSSLSEIRNDKRNYILVNYDKLSRHHFLEGLEKLAREQKIDFICIDEVQLAKARGDRAASNRNKALLALRRLAGDCNPNLYVLGLTATPVINNLYEIKTLCEIITGKDLGDDNLFTGGSISFATAQTAHKYIVNYGFRYNCDYSSEIAENETTIPIQAGRSLYDRINEINKRFKEGKERRGMAGIKDLEDSQIILKLEACKHLIKPGVVIYTQYVGGDRENNTISIISGWLRRHGLDYVLYTGQGRDMTEDEDSGEMIKTRDEELQKFIGDPEKGIPGSYKSKVLIASSVLHTGVDGLQKVSNMIIMLSCPWTYADYEQLKGRFIRRGSNFSEVKIYIPTVSLKLTTGEWSWDKSKWKILQYKKDLSDLIIYGDYCNSNILRIAQNETESSLIKRVLSNIDAPLEFYSEEIHPDKDYEEERRKLGNPKPYKKPRGSCIVHIHKRYNNEVTSEIEADMSSPERRGSMIDYWIDQDKIVGKKGYVDSNTETAGLINDIYGGPDKKVADLGCGPHDPLRKLVTNCKEFFSCTFEPEEITLPLDVVRCDSTRLNMVEDKYFDVVNHTNSHWGTNLDDYVLEDYRILKDDGVLIITSVCPPRRNKYKIIANAYLESGLWEYLVEPVRFGGKSGMTRGIFKKKGI